MAKKKKLRGNKKAIYAISDTLFWIIVGIIILVVVVGGFIIVTQKDISALEFIKNLFRFKR